MERQFKEGSFSHSLLEQSEPILQKIHAHPFVCSLKNGDLPLEKYRYYMIQDYLYLGQYAKCFEIGLERGKDLQFLQICKHYLDRMRTFELQVHTKAFVNLHITTEDLDQAVQNPSSRTYTDYMIEQCQNGGEKEIITAILACAASYEQIADEMVRQKPESLDHEVYGEWVSQYASDSYGNENTVLFDLLDRLVDQSASKGSRAMGNDPSLQVLRNIYQTCMEHELAFWQAAWDCI